MSGERFTLDTNILVCSVDSRAGPRHEMARSVVESAARCDCWRTLQAVPEFFVVATRKQAMPYAEAAEQIDDWLALFPAAAPSATAVRKALASAVGGRAAYWDALLIATAAEAGCAAILTEDLADGSVLHGIRVVNPFGSTALSKTAARLLDLPSPN
jgi:predicted nucleic acid-binding protein